MIFDKIQQLFAKLFNLKQGTFDFEQEMLRQKKRLIFHQKIPNLPEIKQEFGDQYLELLAILNQYDPVKWPSMKENPYKYESMAGTLIYQIKKPQTAEQLNDLIYLEFSLWFGHQYHHFKKRNEFESAIHNFWKVLKS